jgi:ligand-binding sensor domain-containing protein
MEQLYKVDNANSGTNLAGVVIRPDLGQFHTVSCIAIDPSNENHMLVSYSNYGINNVYESSPGTGGSLNWTPLDVNTTLPDMPVRWCMFDPRNSDWAILATEMGIWSTNNLNGTSTNWTAADNNVANTRVDMLRYRATDRLLAAATHGEDCLLPMFLLWSSDNAVGFQRKISGQ